ncbi:UNVERIFIED_CONTAM: Microfibrillar-associated protein 1 [Sesamum radiatum]|uniref:Microfibrillar-associated protein 1 n=1 Tax=Sesamum radiatum TaxID=300843 RepID=A0AAW2NC99_SESRA
MSVTAGVSDTVIAIRDKLRGKIGQTKVKRYWPGKAPEWADDNDEDGDIRMARTAALEKAFPSHEGPDVMRKDDPRLRRLAESRIDNRDEVREDHRRIRQAEIVSTEEEESRRQEGLELEEEDEDALEERRRRIREKLLLRQQEEAALLPEEEEEEVEEEEEEESEYETDSEEEMTGIAMVKPVFVPKSERDTIAERERLEAEERALEEAVKRRMEERKKETKEIVVEKIKEDQEIQKNMELEANIADVDTDDDVNEAEEYEAWKSREIARIKRDREDRDAMLKEKEEIEKVRNMTEEERREWERKNPKPTAPASKSGGSCRNTTTRVHSSKQMLMIMLELQGLKISILATFLHQLERIRWTRPYCLKSCRLSTLVAVEGRNGLILLMRTQLIGIIRKYLFLHKHPI